MTKRTTVTLDERDEQTLATFADPASSSATSWQNWSALWCRPRFSRSAPPLRLALALP